MKALEPYLNDDGLVSEQIYDESLVRYCDANGLWEPDWSACARASPKSKQCLSCLRHRTQQNKICFARYGTLIPEREMIF